MYLLVMATNFLLIIVRPIRYGIWIPADTSRIYVMFFRKVMTNPCILCQISISHRYRDSRFVLFFQCIIKSPAHDAHKGGIFKLHATLDILWQYNGAVRHFFMTFAIPDFNIRQTFPCRSVGINGCPSFATTYTMI